MFNESIISVVGDRSRIDRAVDGPALLGQHGPATTSLEMRSSSYKGLGSYLICHADPSPRPDAVQRKLRIRYQQPLQANSPFLGPHSPIGAQSAPLPHPVLPLTPPQPPSTPRRTESDVHLWPLGPEAHRMSRSTLDKDFEPSPSSCNGLGTYIEVPAALTAMRYNQEHSSITSLSLETPSQPSSVLSGFPAPLLNNTTGYSPETGHYYPPPTSQLFSTATVDPRSRLGSNASSTGMAHTPRTTTLPNPGYNAREVYAGSRPSFMRAAGHIPRSPSYSTSIRRHPLSPTPSPSIGFNSPGRMDPSPYGKGSTGGTPPLLPMVLNGQLVYSDVTSPGSSTHAKIDIQAVIDKGFFLSDGEWTCYRRNYFSCVCSFSLTPNFPNATLQYIPTGSATSYQVFGFAMSISAVVSDSDSQSIDLVQHTPKRDKGPTAKPEKSTGEQFLKVAERKSAKMIVRGRSPGHYQTERRGSTSSGPGGSGGMGSYPPSQVLGGEYAPAPANLLPNAYSGNYEARPGHYTTSRHPDIGMEPVIPEEEAKDIENKREYQYYPSTIYEGDEGRHGIEMFSHRNESDVMMAGTTHAADPSVPKLKHEYEHTLPSIYQPGSAYYSRGCNRFEGRTTSAGFYPTPLPQS
ncbi:putative meiosis-specific protein NDT80 [Rosellinia necatrix]|uniref:Putative meiosis-specific protein NDT80 n=1 Tax=Rosellinia necatrix TaxID=77044 RepID=A0A1W2TGN6_ROSNE|nr:putative meiosis-specific protein NDT80 [Rosellinia necatrix]